MNELAALKETHKYIVTINGTPGVRLAMTVIKKPGSKTTETVTVPYALEFEAVAAAVWVETLPAGQSGSNGDTYDIALSKDGRTLRKCKGYIQKDSRKNIYVNGDHSWELGDF